MHALGEWDELIDMSERVRAYLGVCVFSSVVISVDRDNGRGLDQKCPDHS